LTDTSALLSAASVLNPPQYLDAVLLRVTIVLRRGSISIRFLSFRIAFFPFRRGLPRRGVRPDVAQVMFRTRISPRLSLFKGSGCNIGKEATDMAMTFETKSAAVTWVSESGVMEGGVFGGR
jgi:hypothetical protein